MVREFSLINEKGQEYSLMNIEQYCLLTSPRGLGYEYNTEYEQLGHTFIVNLRKVQQGRIDGTVNFINYDNYTNFSNYLEQSENLKFVYKIPYENGKTKTFFKDVVIQSLDKSEVQTNGLISETIVFDCLSLWYEENKVIYKIEPSTDEIIWDFEWDSKFADYDTRNLEYINKGHIEAPIEVSIMGHVVNPVISLFVEGELYQEVRVKVEIEEFQKLLYGTKENNFYIRREKEDGTKEELFSLDNIDFENDNVIRIPKAKSCELKLTADNEILHAEVTIYPSYKII